METKITYHAASSGVHKQALAWSQIGHLEEQQVCYHVVGGDCHRVQGGHAFWQYIHVLGWHGDQLGPGAVLWQGHDLVANLGANVGKIRMS